MDPLDILHLDIWYEIFKYLDPLKDRKNTLLICKLFYNIGNKIFDPGINDNYAIRNASCSGLLESVKFLLKDPRIDPGTQDNYAIRKASTNGHLEVVKCLLKDSRVDPSTFNNKAIRFASANGHLEIVNCLLKD